MLSLFLVGVRPDPDSGRHVDHLLGFVQESLNQQMQKGMYHDVSSLGKLTHRLHEANPGDFCVLFHPFPAPLLTNLLGAPSVSPLKV